MSELMLHWDTIMWLEEVLSTVEAEPETFRAWGWYRLADETSQLSGMLVEFRGSEKRLDT